MSAPIDSLLPHRGAMRLVEAVVDRSEGTVTCRGRIGAALAAGGEASPWLGIELGAQAAAVLDAGDRAAGGEPRIGYLVGIADATFHRSGLPVDRPLLAVARVDGGLPPLCRWRLEVTVEGDERPAVTAVVTTYLLPEDGDRAR